jgi:Class II flagellar assembly regulator
MRISGPNGPAAPAASGVARRSTSGSFSLPQDEETSSSPAATGGVRSLAGIDALLALQGVESVDERRRRAVKRGHTALDLLDEMKLALLSGRLDPGMLLKLKSAAAGLKDLSGDPRVDQVLAEIDLRVEVELAKVESAATP